MSLLDRKVPASGQWAIDVPRLSVLNFRPLFRNMMSGRVQQPNLQDPLRPLIGTAFRFHFLHLALSVSRCWEIINRLQAHVHDCAPRANIDLPAGSPRHRMKWRGTRASSAAGGMQAAAGESFVVDCWLG